MLYRVWIRTLALAVGALSLALAIGGVSPALSGALIFAAGAATLWTAGLLIVPRLRTRDRYDLGELARVHEETGLLEGECEIESPDTVVCFRCHTEYPFRLRACPRCGASA